MTHILIPTPKVAYQAGPDAKPVYALEGSSKSYDSCAPVSFTDIRLSVAVAGSAIKWLRDSMSLIQSAADVNDLAAKEPSTGGVYFVTAFSGLLAPYWDPGAAGLLIGQFDLQPLRFKLMTPNRNLPIYKSLTYCSCNVGGKCVPDACDHREHEA